MPMGELKREDSGKLASANYEVKYRLTTHILTVVSS